MPSHYRPIIENEVIHSGDIIKDFRGESWKFIGLTDNNSKIYCESLKPSLSRREFYPSVFNAQILQISER